MKGQKLNVKRIYGENSNKRETNLIYSDNPVIYDILQGYFIREFINAICFKYKKV